MEIAFFTEGNWQGKVPRDHPNMRTEMAWMCALDATHYPIDSMHMISYETKFDLGIVIIPKNNPEFDVSQLKQFCTQVASMQEGPHWYFQDYELDKQIWFYNTLMEMDFLYVHNELDKKYFEGLTGKVCKVMPSLMIDDTIDHCNLIHVNDRKNVMIGGNFCHWYGGFDSYMVAQEFGTEIHVPSMGRRIDGEDQMDNLYHLPYMNWKDWISTLSGYKYGVHLMRTQAAGTFALNCSYLNIPCIGYEGLDTQMILHPALTVPIGDIAAARKLAEKLRNDDEFYLYCTKVTGMLYKEHYTEDKFLCKATQKY
jgi:hypothetical protein